MLRNRKILSREAKEATKTLIKECMECNLQIVKDSYGRSSIGYRHFLTPQEIQELSPKITPEKADQLLESDLEASVYREAECYWGVHLKSMDAWRVAAILDATYSCGNLRWPKLTQAVFRSNWEDASEELMDSRYAHQVGARAKRNACILRQGKLFTLQNQNWDIDEELDQ